MKSSKSYKCPTCGKMHEDWPAIAFDSPTGYNVLPENIKNEIGSLANDFCIIHHPEQTDRFIRATLALKVVDQCENLEYGVWVSLSEKNFHDYKNNYNNPNHEAKYFGWLCNDIPEYEIIENIPTTVFTRTNGQRSSGKRHKFDLTNFQVEIVKGPLDTFLIEPFLPHDQSDEYYISINSVREGDE